MGGTVLQLKRVSFDPGTFVGAGWKISEQDEQSLSVASVDLATISLGSVVDDGDTRVGGFERISRLKMAGWVLLDARAFLVLWENKRMIPRCWEERIGGGPPHIYFDGTIVRSPCGHRNTFCLYRQGGEWMCDHIWLALDLPVNHVSAVIKASLLAKAS
ncbi:MAG: hypothetical protein WC246_00785 [Candidatus Paceibacterota bacterium]|jgi:hypothetical protein